MIALPNNIYKLKEIRALNKEDRKRYFTTLILEALKLNPDGVMATALHSELKRKGYNYSDLTLRKYLDLLVSVREAYVTQHGLSMVYHLNGKLIWDGSRKNVDFGDVSYWFYELNNPRGKFVFIQEKEKDSFNIESVSGGIVVPAKFFDRFLHSLSDFSRNMKEDVYEGPNKN